MVGAFFVQSRQCQTQCRCQCVLCSWAWQNFTCWLLCAQVEYSCDWGWVRYVGSQLFYCRWTKEGREHSEQLCYWLPNSSHSLACLHLQLQHVPPRDLPKVDWLLHCQVQASQRGWHCLSPKLAPGAQARCASLFHQPCCLLLCSLFNSLLNAFGLGLQVVLFVCIGTHKFQSADSAYVNVIYAVSFCFCKTY